MATVLSCHIRLVVCLIKLTAQSSSSMNAFHSLP